MSVLFLLRHGETHWNVEQRMQGRGDSPLTARGREQAAGHGDVLARLGGVDRLLVSPSGRTRETAAIVNARLESAGGAAPVSYHDALMERHSGEWEGLTLAEIQARYAEDLRARDADPYFHRPPGGENHADMEIRVAALVAMLRHRVTGGLASAGGLAAAGGPAGAAGGFAGAGSADPVVGALGPARGPERIAVVTHGIMSRVILKLLLDLEPGEAAMLRHPNALLYRLEFTPSGVRHSHFLEGAGPFEGLLRH